MKRMIGLAALLVILAAPLAARAQVVVVPRVSYYTAPAPVVYSSPVVSYYQPTVSYYTPAVPVTSYRWGVFGRRLVPTYGYAAPVVAAPAPVYVQRSYYYAPPVTSYYAPVVVYP